MNSDFKLDHIGIAVKNIEEAAGIYSALGFKGLHLEVVPTEKVRVGMYELANQARIELLEPTAPDSPVGRFLAKRGPGVHHICFQVKDLKGALHQLKANGVRLINEEPTPGAHQCQVAFIHPSSTGGLLIELSEPLNQGDD